MPKGRSFARRLFGNKSKRVVKSVVDRAKKSKPVQWVKRIRHPEEFPQRRVKKTLKETRRILQIMHSRMPEQLLGLRTAKPEKHENILLNIEREKYKNVISKEKEKALRDLREDTVKHLEALQDFLHKEKIPMYREFNENSLILEAVKKNPDYNATNEALKLLHQKLELEKRLLELIE